MMNETQNMSTPEEIGERSLLEILQLQTRQIALWTLLYAFLGAALYYLVSLVPMPYLMISLFKLGILPGIVIISLTGAIRGPVAGFLSGYLGVVIFDLLSYGVIVTLTLPAAAYGVLGFVVGLGTYHFDKGRSLGKLAILSVVGFLFTTLLIVVIGLMVEGYATMAAIGFVMLPLMTLGLPTALFLTPTFARIWHAGLSKVYPNAIIQ